MEKKVVWTLALKGYPKEMTNLTFPWIREYARKINAEFRVIDERRLPLWPVTAEKMQIWDLGKENDWNVFIDADALISPELFDVTSMVAKDTVVYTGQDMSAMRFRPNLWTIRDARYLGACSWFWAISDQTIDMIRKPDKDWFHAIGKPESDKEEDLVRALVGEIFPTNGERTANIAMGGQPITPDKLIEDYIFSTNIGRYGLKHVTIEGHIKPRFGRADQMWWHPYALRNGFYWHQYTMPIDQKVVTCLGVMEQWGMLTDEIRQEYAPYLKKLQSAQEDQARALQAAMQAGLIRPS
jgi:glycosyltransferase involved in cell wall biosynthesis